MRLGRLDLNLLVALDRLLTHQSVTLASEEMHLTQSAMSSALRRLRDYFDDPLLVQVGRQMQLTPRARALRQPLREILIRIEATISSEMKFDPETSDREFRIILSDYTLHVLAPLVMAEAARQKATVRFRWLPQVREPSAVIERGDADLVVAPGLILSDEHPSEAIYEEEFLAVLWAESPYSKQELTLERYLEAKHVITVPQIGMNSVPVDLLGKLGIVRDIDVECFSFAALAPLVVGTDRIATVHSTLAHQATRWLPLVTRSLPFAAPNIVEHLQWHRHMEQDPSLSWLRQLFREAAATLKPGHTY